jgi:hypothetical protein
MTEYLVQRTRSRKLWVPYSGLMWPPPRLVQLLAMARCKLGGHPWRSWNIDDMEGPGEPIMDGDEEVAFMPYCSRISRPGEFGTRSCRRCGACEMRWPVADAPPRFQGKRVTLPT